VSITEKTPATEQAPSAPSAWHRARKPLAVGAALAVLAGGAFAVANGTGRPASKGTTAASSTAPIVMPAQLAGLRPLTGTADQYASSTWQAKAKAASGGAPVAGHLYGGTGAARSIRAAAARADLSGKLELGWAADAGHAVGDATCTQNVQLVPGGRVAVRPTVIVCWRKADHLSAYIAMIDPRTTLTDADGGKAIDELWAAVSKS